MTRILFFQSPICKTMESSIIFMSKLLFLFTLYCIQLIYIITLSSTLSCLCLIILGYRYKFTIQMRPEGLDEISQRKAKMQRRGNECTLGYYLQLVHSITHTYIYIYTHVDVWVYTRAYIFEFCTVLDTLHLQSHLLINNISVQLIY